MKLKSSLKISLLSFLVLSTTAHAGWQYVGSFEVQDGAVWTSNPPVYSGVEAAAMLFGGDAADYAISTNPNTTDSSTITHTAWASTWGGGCHQQADDYKVDVLPEGYRDPWGTGNAVSAYVQDHCGMPSAGWDTSGQYVNYVWVDAVPTLTCKMFEPPLISDIPETDRVERLAVAKKSKRAIPVKTTLLDEDGNIVLDLTIPPGENGIVSYPVLNLAYTDSATGDLVPVDDTSLATSNNADEGNIFRFDETDNKWIFNLSTKDLSSGLYTIEMVSGDNNAYRLDSATCTITFEKQ